MTVLKLDIDLEFAIAFEDNDEKIRNKLIILAETYLCTFDVHVWKTAHGFHYYIKTDKFFEDYQIIALQCILGSDLKREMFNLMRVARGMKDTRWNVLYCTKFKKGKIVSEEKDYKTYVIGETKHDR